MKRKLVQHGKTTLVISLPSKWTKKYDLKKGTEINIDEKDNILEISHYKSQKEEIFEFDVTGMDSMIPRYIHALYKLGVDVLKINYDDFKTFKLIKNSLGKETVGYEIVEQNATSCIIKNVTGDSNDFDILLKKTLLLLYTSGVEILDAIITKDKEKLKTTFDYELTNNVFTSLCRRYLNKKGHADFKKIGPIYYIVEDVENIADHFKYMVSYLLEKDTFSIDKDVMKLFEDVNLYLNKFFELFYRFDKKYVLMMQEERKRIINTGTRLLESKRGENAVVVHHLMTITQKTFCLIGPYMINII